MNLALRHRILLTLLPLLLLLAVVGTAGVVLLSRLGNSVNAILRENYDSVIAMERLNEALERIDSSFQFSLSGQHAKARAQYAAHWRVYRENLEKERSNITLDGEAELVEQLTQLTAQYERAGDAFHALDPAESTREQQYFGSGGLLERFNSIKTVSGQIRHMNQENMENASRDARRLAGRSLVWFGVGLFAAILLAMFFAWHTVRTVLRPIRGVTEAAVGISAGNLDQVVPHVSRDELGELSKAFNSMARSLREFRESQSARLLRIQQTTQATVDAFPDPVIVIDTEGRVEIANPVARRLLGVRSRQSADGDGANWQPPVALQQPLEEALHGQQDYSPEGFDRAVHFTSGGRELTLLPRILTIRNPRGDALGAAVVLQDVTRLQLLDQAKSNLVATASHELKTPLTSLRLAVHLLLEETVGPLTPKQMELLLDARDNCERLLAVVNNLLDLARLEERGQQLNLQLERPESLLRAAADAIRSRADDQGVQVAIEAAPGLPAVMVDEARLSNAFQNLLDNALTYTDRGGRITLKAEQAGRFVAMAVADTGIGIPAEHLPQLFEKFFRVPGQSRGHGTGLGLSIVREIVAAQGGTITCESAPGQGTEFRIKFPAATGAPLTPKDQPTPSDNDGGPHVN
jgi:signal transduction histidine kinase